MNVSNLSAGSYTNMNNQKKELKDMTHDDFMNVINDKIDEISDKLESGETETSYSIGGSSFTKKEWDKLLEDFDDSEEKLKEAMKEEIERLKEEDEELRRILEGIEKEEQMADTNEKGVI